MNREREDGVYVRFCKAAAQDAFDIWNISTIMIKHLSQMRRNECRSK